MAHSAPWPLAERNAYGAVETIPDEIIRCLLDQGLSPAGLLRPGPDESQLRHPRLERRRPKTEPVRRAPGPRMRQPVLSRTPRMCSISTSVSLSLRLVEGRRNRHHDAQPRPIRHDHRALDDVPELADVARPRVVLQRVHVLPRDRRRSAYRTTRENSSTKRQTRSGMSSTRSRSGGTSIGKTFSR